MSPDEVRVASLSALLVSLLACSVDVLDLTGKPCPCPDYLVCDAGTCVDPSALSTTASAATSSSSATTGTGGGPCDDCPVLVPGEGDIPSFDIDPTEVTQAAYQAFVDAGVDPATQPAYCAFNMGFEPHTDLPTHGCDAPLDPVTYPNLPVTCVDWCDAQAYCTWLGRRLCGRIGGGTLVVEKGADATQSEWYRACSAAGTREYPYEGPFVVENCKVAGGPGGARALDVKTLPACVGGYEGLFDMSGNIEEWEDACTEGVDPENPADDTCNFRGGAFWSDATEARCDSLLFRNMRQRGFGDVGFRCCGG